MTHQLKAGPRIAEAKHSSAPEKHGVGALPNLAACHPHPLRQNLDHAGEMLKCQ